MAEITAVKFYLGKLDYDYGDWYCEIRNVGLITDSPIANTVLGTSEAVPITDIPLNANKDWVTFTFSTPVTITQTGFYAAVLKTTHSRYASTQVYVYYASDFNDPAEERGWVDYPLDGTDGWTSGGYDIAYEVVGLSNIGATTPTSSYVSARDAFGLRFYVESGHSKPTNPTPTDADTEVDWSTPLLDWDGNGDTYDVYVSTATPFVASDLVAEGISDTTYTLSTEQKNNFADSDSILYWRVDSSVTGETLTGDTWSFDPRPGQASSPTPATAGTDIELSQQLAWTPGTNATEVNVKITHPDTLEITSLLSGELASSYDWTSDYLTWEKTFSWEVESTNFYGTTSGPTWTFTTLDLDHLRTTYNTIDGGSGPYDGGTEGVDFWYTGLNNVITVKRLVLLAKDRFYFEELS